MNKLEKFNYFRWGILKTSKIIFFIALIILSSCSKHKILITAHRGSSGEAPENTMSAYLLAIDMGSHYAELDVQETSDDVLILYHDTTYNRTTGVSANVWDLSYLSIKEFDAGSWKNESYRGEPIPLFTDIIDSVNGRMLLNVEIKMNGHQDGLTEHVVQVLEDKDFIDQCIVTSFDFDAIDKVKKINPKIIVGYVFSKIPNNIDVFSADVDLLSVKNIIVTPEFVHKAHKSGKEVHVWGKVDDKEEMIRLRNLKVDNIITNHPDRWFEFLNQ
ncbi:MAG: glycerophosphodiester phosphodiesterase [Flavobacteriales bacterium]|jgi:glycerophosphoryl diester phosphodiesterase|nr:glycerophosphodiester phosphodiesterase [Flavobacteriales bacterium]